MSIETNSDVPWGGAEPRVPQKQRGRRRNRREVIKMAGAAAAGGAVAALLSKSGVAEAAPLDPVLLAAANDGTGGAPTAITSDNAFRALDVTNSGDGAAINALAGGAFGNAITATALQASALDARAFGPNYAVFVVGAGPGIFVEAFNGNGIHSAAHGTFGGVVGDGLTDGTGTWGQSGNSVGAVGSSVNSAGVLGKARDGVGVHAKSKTRPGVVGEAESGPAVFGIGGVEFPDIPGPFTPPTPPTLPPAPPTPAGAGGPTTPGTTGVAGQSSGEAGVHGISQDFTGVVGVSTNGVGTHGVGPTVAGVVGESAGGIGVHGSAPSGTGVRGSSTSGIGVQAVGGASWALDVQGTSQFATVGMGTVPANTAGVVVSDARVTANSHVGVMLTGNPGGIQLPPLPAASGGDDDDDHDHDTVQTGGTIVVGATFNTKTVTEVDVDDATSNTTFTLTYDPGQDKFTLTSSLGPSQTITKNNIPNGTINLNFNALKVKLKFTGPAESAEDAFGNAIHGKTIITGGPAVINFPPIGIGVSHVVRDPGIGFTLALTGPAQQATPFTYFIVN